MRRIKTKVLVQAPLYLIEVEGYQTTVKCEVGIYKSFDMCYYKKGNKYNIVLGFNGTIVGSARTIKEVENFIPDFLSALKKDIENGIIDIEKEISNVKNKMTYTEWYALAEEIKKETGIDVSFADREGELSYVRLVSYLKDNPDFNAEVNDGCDVDRAVKSVFGAPVHGMICKLIGKDMIRDYE